MPRDAVSSSVMIPKLQSVKTVIRVKDYRRSRRFYEQVLGLPVVEEWDQDSDVGCIFAFGAEPGSGYLEISPTSTDRRHRAVHELESNDKLELQLRALSLDPWIERFSRLDIAFDGPVERPWGNSYLWLRDPDGLRIALFRGGY